MKPPANESPAPVGSNTSPSGYAGAKNTDRSVNMNAPCSPFLMITWRGPRFMIQRAAFTRFVSSVSWRASPSLSVMRSTRSSSARRSERRLSIQKFIVSQATSFGFSTWLSTSSCSRGSMLARNTNGARRNCSGIFGRKCENTPRRVSSVSAELRSWRYRPRQRNDSPSACSSPARSTPRCRERCQLVDRVVAADDADELHRREVARGRREERPRSA